MPDFTSTVDIARPAADPRDALAWARAVWEDAPPPVRAFLRAGWLGLGLTTRLSPERVLGWTVVSATPDEAVLETPSPILTARNIVRLDPDRVRWTTEVTYDRFPARQVWAVAVPFHEIVIPARLRHVAGQARPGDLQHQIVTTFQRRLGNPVLSRLPGQTLLETTGRSSGLPRRTPIGGRRVGQEFWLVSEFGERSQYVRNIQADPRVRLRLHGRWLRGVARLLPEDDARARLKSLPRLNSTAVQAFGTDLLTIRIDLD
ncbi:nitroreductase/quinone reductase family protein [Amycolatopsis silviterrae]|uniref:Nitroreductase/quinone reductase family protein n=1 Tax=Amycolatopsis silviterrae TaxID=1656914 RepID=A0ABW5HNU2_9PSEU